MGSYCTNIAKDACSIFDAGLGKFDVVVVCHEAGPDFDHILSSDSLAHGWLLPTPTLGVALIGTLREHAAWWNHLHDVGEPTRERKGKTQEACFSLEGGGASSGLQLLTLSVWLSLLRGIVTKACIDKTNICLKLGFWMLSLEVGWCWASSSWWRLHQPQICGHCQASLLDQASVTSILFHQLISGCSCARC